MGLHVPEKKAPPPKKNIYIPTIMVLYQNKFYKVPSLMYLIAVMFTYHYLKMGTSFHDSEVNNR